VSGRRACGALGLLLGISLGAAAEDKPLWEAGMGVGGLRLPHYRGSDQSNGWLLPVPYFVYRGKILRADRDGARAVLFDGRSVDFDISLAASAPANSRDDVAREGMPDLPATFEIGPKLNSTLARGDGWKFDLRVPLRTVITLDSHPRSLGWTLSPVLNLDMRLPQSLDFGVQAGPIWNDRRLNEHTYSVAPVYATATRPAYSAGGGYAGWQATVGLSRRVGRLWMGAFVRADSVAGAVFEDSPLVRSRQQLAYGLAMSWVFATSAERVAGDD
jgi:outer membrane scaffolding protein for murein synthesis (MipA/OmpV family)